jgi:hypothetical protein
LELLASTVFQEYIVGNHVVGITLNIPNTVIKGTFGVSMKAISFAKLRALHVEKCLRCVSRYFHKFNCLKPVCDGCPLQH